MSRIVLKERKFNPTNNDLGVFSSVDLETVEMRYKESDVVNDSDGNDNNKTKNHVPKPKDEDSIKPSFDNFKPPDSSKGGSGGGSDNKKDEDKGNEKVDLDKIQEPDIESEDFSNNQDSQGNGESGEGSGESKDSENQPSGGSSGEQMNGGNSSPIDNNRSDKQGEKDSGQGNQNGQGNKNDENSDGSDNGGSGDSDDLGDEGGENSSNEKGKQGNSKDIEGSEQDSGESDGSDGQQGDQNQGQSGNQNNGKGNKGGSEQDGEDGSENSSSEGQDSDSSNNSNSQNGQGGKGKQSSESSDEDSENTQQGEDSEGEGSDRLDGWDDEEDDYGDSESELEKALKKAEESLSDLEKKERQKLEKEEESSQKQQQTPKQLSDVEKKAAKDLIEDAIRSAKDKGDESNVEEMNDLLSKLDAQTLTSMVNTRGKGDWKHQLDKIFDQATGIEISINPNLVNKRIEDAPPGREDDSNQITNIAVLIDQSGSMGSHKFKTAISHVDTMLSVRKLGNVNFHIVGFAAWSLKETAATYKRTKGRTLKKILLSEYSKAGGGTHLTEAFQVLATKVRKVDAIMIFTDAEVYDGDTFNNNQMVMSYVKRNKRKIIWVLTHDESEARQKSKIMEFTPYSAKNKLYVRFKKSSS